jgi:hypothetical protein
VVRRLLVVRCPGLLDEDEQGRAGRNFADVVAAVEALTPVVDVVAPGMSSLTTRGPSRYFGGDQALGDLVTGIVATRCGHEVGVGVADGLFAAVLAATMAADEGRPVIVEPSGTPEFLAPWPVAVLDRPDLTSVLERLGVHHLGQFAALPRRHLAARFGTDAATCHDVATGQRGELAGIRRPVRYRRVDHDPAGTTTQAGFWGVGDDIERSALQAVARITAITGPAAVLVGRQRDGRSPGEWARLVPWDAGRRPGRRRDLAGAAPWPGRIPRPAPTLVHARPPSADLVGADGRPVGVSSHGEATAVPARLSIDGGSWRKVHAWAGPWPIDERWWAARRRRAHLQVLTASGAHLLVREQRCWWVEATYD